MDFKDQNLSSEGVEKKWKMLLVLMTAIPFVVEEALTIEAV